MPPALPSVPTAPPDLLLAAKLPPGSSWAEAPDVAGRLLDHDPLSRLPRDMALPRMRTHVSISAPMPGIALFAALCARSMTSWYDNRCRNPRTPTMSHVLDHPRKISLLPPPSLPPPFPAPLRAHYRALSQSALSPSHASRARALFPSLIGTSLVKGHYRGAPQKQCRCLHHHQRHRTRWSTRQVCAQTRAKPPARRPPAHLHRQGSPPPAGHQPNAQMQGIWRHL